MRPVVHHRITGRWITPASAPLAAVANRIVGPIGATVILIAAIVSCLGNTTGDVLASPRLLFAGANDGFFPKILARVHPRFATPYIAIISYALLIFIFSISGGFKQLAVLASCSLLLIYLGVVLATVKLRMKKGDGSEKTFKAPGGLITPLVAATAIIWLLSHLERNEILSTGVFIAFIGLVYLLMTVLRKKE